jgi:uncharacterized membrane protein
MRRVLMILSIATITALVILLVFHSSSSAIAGQPYSPPSASMEVMLKADPQIKNTIHRVCFNCHSDQPKYPWYASIWPSSLLIQHDRQKALARLNFSQWDRLSPEMSRIRLLDACTMMTEGKMPLWYYRPFHFEARLSSQEIQHFCAWAHLQ